MKNISLLIVLTIAVCFSHGQTLDVLKSIFGNEFIIHKNEEGFEIHRKDFITVSDYQKYQNDVRDSVAFELIFLNIEKDNEALDYLKLTNQQRKTTNGSDRKKLRNEYSLNRNDEKLREGLYHNKLLEPLLAPLIIPFWKRYLQYSPYTFDDRSVFYRSPESQNNYSILLNHWIIAENSQHPNDLINVIAKRYLDFNIDHPAVGLSSQNLEGCFSWKKNELESLLRKNDIHSKVLIEPIEKNLNLDFSIKKEDLIKHWKISNKEYQSFLNHVEDSLLREYLYFNISDDKEFFRYLDNKKYPFDYFYFSQIHGETYAYERSRNRYYHNLNYASRIKKNNPEVKKLIEKFNNEIIKEKIPHVFLQMDAKMQISNFTDIKYSEDYYNSNKDDLYDLDSIKVNLSRVSGKNNNDNIVSLLSYNAALAFYHWKYPISKSIKMNDWKKYVFPSQEEFNLLKKGVIPEIKVSIPIKAFSYYVVLNH